MENCASEPHFRYISGLINFPPITMDNWDPKARIGSASRDHASTYHQPAQSDQIAFSNSLDLYRSSPESGDLHGKPGVSITPIYFPLRDLPPLEGTHLRTAAFNA
jgi:hypothetical protein